MVGAVLRAPKTPAESNESLFMPEDRHGQDFLRERCSLQAALFFPRLSWGTTVRGYVPSSPCSFLMIFFYLRLRAHVGWSQGETSWRPTTRYLFNE